METFSALLAICAGNSPVTGGFPSQRPVTQSLDVFFDLRLLTQLSKQSWGGWFETPSRPLWRHCNVQDLGFTSGVRNWLMQLWKAIWMKQTSSRKCFSGINECISIHAWQFMWKIFKIYNVIWECRFLTFLLTINDYKQTSFFQQYKLEWLTISVDSMINSLGLWCYMVT